jgi:heterodisulfide reductase subunit A2
MKEKIGVYVCECGPNIGSKVDIEKIMQKISQLEDFKEKDLVIKNHRLLCSVEGKKFLENEINENQLTHLVCAACSPRDHNSTFINVCKKTELNPYLYTMVNIREHCAWIIPDKDKATEKAINYIHAGMSRVLYQSALEEKQLDSNPDVLVIGGGIAGMEAALSLASNKRRVHIIEKEEKLGGKSAALNKLLPRQGVNLNILKQKISDVKADSNISVYTNTRLEKAVGFLGNFEIELKTLTDPVKTYDIVAGAIVISTGFDLQDAAKLNEFNFTEKDNVFYALEIEEMYSRNEKITLRDGRIPDSVALLHCVGRKELGYCSRTCCNYLLKISQYFKEQSPDTEIYDIYKHQCFPNKEDEKFYEAVKSGKVNFIHAANIQVEGNTVNYLDVDGTEKSLDAEMIVLATGMIPAKGTVDLAELLQIDLHETGFYQEAHLKINPISTITDGVFVVGAAHGLGGLSDAVIQAQAAAGKILTQLIPGQKIIPEVMVSEIMVTHCTGCKTCLDVCGFGAIYFDEDRGISVVNEAICRGCGNCVGSCPSGSIRTRHFTNPQLYQEIKEALR